MTETTTLRTPIDILRKIPELIEHTLVESLVILPFDDNHGGAVLRFDLPRQNLNPIEAKQYATAVVGYLCHLEGYQRVVTAVFTEQEFDGPGMPPWRLVEEALHEALTRGGFTTIASLCRAGNGWGEYGCDDPDCSGFGPRSLSEVAEESVTRIGLTTPRDVLTLLLESNDIERRTLVAERMASVRRDGTLFERALTAWDKRLTSPRWNKRGLSRACAALQLALFEEVSSVVRWTSSTLFGLGAGADGALEEMWLAMLEAADSGTPFDVMELKHSFPTVERERLERAAFQTRDLLTVTPPHLETQVLAALAILEWARGRGSFAVECALFALQRDEDFWLAHLVVWLCEHGVVPPWFGVVPVGENPYGLGAVA